MATAQELETLFVRLTGDGSELQKMLEEARQATDRVSKSISDAAGKIEGIADSVTHFARTAFQGLQALGIGEFLHKSFEAFGEKEQIMIGLTSTIKANGEQVKETLEHYEHFAKAISETTTISEKQALSLVKMAETYSLTGAAAETAAKNAIALGAATGGDASSMLRLTAALQKGDMQMVHFASRMVPQLRSIKDESELVAKAQKLISGGMAAAEEQANSAQGVFKRLTNTMEEMYEEFGKVVADAIKPLVNAFRDLVTWFKELNPSVKQAIIVITALITGFLALGPAIAVISTVAGSLFSPWLLVLAPIGAAISMLVDKLGGMEAVAKKVQGWIGGAWDWIRDKTSAFLKWLEPYYTATLKVLTAAWEWVRDAAVATWSFIQEKFNDFIAYVTPIFRAYVGVFKAEWELIKTIAVGVWGYIKEAFKIAVDYMSAYWDLLTESFRAAFLAMGIDFKATFISIRDLWINALIAVEFVLRHLEDVWEVVLIKIQLSYSKMIDDNTRFIDELGYTLAWLEDNWVAAFRDVFENTKTIFSDLTNNIVEVLKNLPDLVQGKVDFSKLWKPMGDNFQKTIKEFKIPPATASELTQALQQLLDAKTTGIGLDFKKFLADRRKEIFTDLPGTPEEIKKTEKKAEQIGNEIGAAMGKGIGHEKFDAVLSRSAEALTRISEYKSKIAGEDPSGRFNASSSSGAESNQRKMQEQINLLKDIRDGIKDQAKGPKVEIAPAGL